MICQRRKRPVEPSLWRSPQSSESKELQSQRLCQSSHLFAHRCLAGEHNWNLNLLFKGLCQLLHLLLVPVLRLFLGNLCDVGDWHNSMHLWLWVCYFRSFLHWVHPSRLWREYSSEPLSLVTAYVCLRISVQYHASGIVGLRSHEQTLWIDMVMVGHLSHRLLPLVMSRDAKVVILWPGVHVCIEWSSWTRRLQVHRTSLRDRLEALTHTVLVLKVPLVHASLDIWLWSGWSSCSSKVESLVVHPLLVFSREWEVCLATLWPSFKLSSTLEAEFTVSRISICKVDRILLHDWFLNK